VPEAADVAIADADVGLAAQQRRDERRNVLAGVLIVGVGVDDDVGPRLEAGVDARLKGRTRWSTPLARATSDVPSRDPSSTISTSIASTP
jgi:hypothetical protein